MTLNQANQIKKTMDDMGYDCEVVPAYIGRGFARKPTPAIVTEYEGGLKEALRVQGYRPSFRSLNRDQMGRSACVYY